MTRVSRIILGLGILIQIQALANEGEKPNPFSAYMNRCHTVLSAVPWDVYEATLKRRQLTRADLRAAEQIVKTSFFETPLIRSRLSYFSAHPHGLTYLGDLFYHFQASVSAYVRGLDVIAFSEASKLAMSLNAHPVARVHAAEVMATVQQFATHPLIERPYALAELILNSQSTIEGSVIQGANHIKGLKELRFPGANYLGPLIAGPRQIEMVRLVLQYTQTRPNEKVLEIGYGELAVLVGLRHLLPGRDYVGIDPLVLPEKANEVLAPERIQLVQGVFPDSAFDEVAKRGPYTVVAALDTIKKSNNVLSTTVDPLDFARAIYKVMAENSTLVIVNDNADEPYFDDEQAQEVGFEIVRWRHIYELPRELKTLLPYNPTDKNAGKLSIFVLRKGEPRSLGSIKR